MLAFPPSFFLSFCLAFFVGRVDAYSCVFRVGWVSEGGCGDGIAVECVIAHHRVVVGWVGDGGTRLQQELCEEGRWVVCGRRSGGGATIGNEKEMG